MVKEERLLSVGIDIGTTTMSMVVSAITIGNTVYGFGIPNIKILKKEVLFRGEVRYTPFSDTGDIDQRSIEQYIDEQFKSAEIAPSQIKTGAVIVTGRAAETRNAEVVSQALSRISGAFVVATAGAHLEAAISGRGSGMAKISSERKCRTLNLDIGGGTTNVALFHNGALERTFCFNIGGRILRFSAGTRILSQCSPHAHAVASRLGISLKAGSELSSKEVQGFIDVLAQCLFSFISGDTNDLARELSIDNRFDIPVKPADWVSFSGGVGRLFYQEIGEEDAFAFSDLGPSLASALRRLISDSDIQVVQPEETIFATVIGAGTHTVGISGSTIYLSNPEVLPLRDNPVVSIGDTSLPDWDRSIRLKMTSFSETTGRLPVFFMTGMGRVGFAEVREKAERIAELANTTTLRGPLILLCQDDVGKIFGGLLRNRVYAERSVISVDQVFAEEMDYVDIGEPLYGGSVVPVVVKTLVFPN